MKKSAIITATLAAGSSASPYSYDIVVHQQFCQKTCVSRVPVFAPQITVERILPVGTNQYELVLNVQGTIAYTPCHACESAVVPVNQYIKVPVFSATAIESATIVQSPVQNSMVRNGCKPCSSRFESRIPISITLTTA